MCGLDFSEDVGTADWTKFGTVTRGVVFSDLTSQVDRSLSSTGEFPGISRTLRGTRDGTGSGFFDPTPSVAQMTSNPEKSLRRDVTRTIST